MRGEYGGMASSEIDPLGLMADVQRQTELGRIDLNTAAVNPMAAEEAEQEAERVADRHREIAQRQQDLVKVRCVGDYS